MARRRRLPERSSAAAAGAADVVALRPYSIGTAARLAGLAPATVRMWEVRYQFLEPDRTGGGHRLYSEDDVRVLRAVKRLLDAGLRIGAVARMPRESIVAEAEKHGLHTAAAAEPALFTDRERLLEEIVAAAMQLDADRVAALLDRPRLLVDGADVVLDLYLPLLVRIGDLWHEGELAVAVEHFVEKLVTARFHAVLASTPTPTSGRLALVACVPHERHEGGALAAAILLKRAGFDVVFLGGDLPVTDLEHAARTSEPAVVVLAATMRPAAPVRASLAEAFARPPLRDLPVVVGGRSADVVAGTLAPRSLVVCSDLRAVAADAARALRG